MQTAFAQDCESIGGIDDNVGDLVIVCEDSGDGDGGGGGGGGGLSWFESPGAWSTYQCEPQWQLGNRVELFLELTEENPDGSVTGFFVVLCYNNSGDIYQWDYWIEDINDPVVDPQTVLTGLLVRLESQVTVPEPTMAMSPPLDGTHLVGIQTWFWIDETDWESQEVSDTDQGMTVTLTAVPTELRFFTGDGVALDWEGVITCEAPGLSWEPGLGDEVSTCRYVYDFPSAIDEDGTFEVHAESDWELTWVATGPLAAGLPSTTGVLGALTTASPPASLEVLEVQAVIDNS